MPVYTCKGLSGNQNPILEFARKGLKLTSSTLSAAGIVGHPDRKQLAFGSYMHNIADFMHATETQKKITLGATGHAIDIPYSEALQVKPPPVGVSFKKDKKPSQDVILEWFNRRGCHSTIHQGITVYIFPEPAGDMLEKLVDLECEVNTRTPAGIMNIEGYSAWVMVWKIITLFLATHTYPAFTSSLDDSEVQQPYGEDITFTLKSVNKSKAKKPRFAIPEHEGYPEEAEAVEYTMDKNEYPVSALVAYAKPAPFYPRINFGPPGDVPTMAGIVFPYFHGLINPDFTFAPGVITRFFLSCLGNDRTEILSAHSLMKRGVQSFAESPEGLTVAHILQGIQLALECQARLYCIHEDGVYGGFVLLGYGFSVKAQEKVHVPVDPDQVLSDLQSVVSHKRAVQQMCDLLNRLEVREDMMGGEEVTPETIKNARRLHHEVHIRKFVPGVEDAIVEKAKELAYPERYHLMEVEKLCDALDHYRYEKTPDLDQPMYIGGRYILRKDLKYSILSQFGPVAPSFITVNGDSFKIQGIEQEWEQAENRKTRFPFIAVTGKPLTTAMADWDRMFKESEILLNIRERAGASRTKRFVGEAQEQLWRCLKENVPVVRNAGIGRKRTHEDPVVERDTAAESTTGVVKKRLRLL